MVASSFADVFTTALVARERAVERGIVLVGARAARFLATVLVLVTVADVRWIAATYALEGVVELVAGGFFVWRTLGVVPGLPTRRSIIGYWQYARPLLVIGPVGMIQDSIDRVAVTQWAGLTAAGYYHVARGMWEMFSSILAPSTMLLFARLSAIFSERTPARDAEARTLFYSGAEKLLFVTAPAGYVVWVVAGPLLGLVFGPDFVHAEGAVRIFVAATLVAAVVNPYVQAVYALDVVGRFVPVIVLRFVVYLALLAALIPDTRLGGLPTLGLGDEGGALARLFAVAFPAWVYVRWTRELVGLGFYHATWRYLGSFAVALSVFEVALRAPLPEPLARSAAAVLGLGAYAATLVALHPRSLKTLAYCRSLLSPVDFWHFFRREVGRR
jgi:O-antigen/teichoic acid export membrane protein